MRSDITFRDHMGREMVPLRCQKCGEQIGLQSPGYTPDPETVIALCYACAAVGEAERITRDAF